MHRYEPQEDAIGSRSRRRPAPEGDASPTPSPQSAGSPSLDNSFVNELMEQANALPQEAGVDLQRAAVSFDLGANLQITEDPDLSTTARTRVWLTLARTQLRLQCDPPLLLDLTWPLSNVAVGGFTYDFASGQVSDVRVESTQAIAISVTGTVRSRLSEAVQALFEGTPVSAGGYDPYADPDFGNTMQQVLTNAASAGDAQASESPSLGAEDLERVGLSATFDVVRAISRSTSEGEIAVAAGASMTARAITQGSLGSATEDPRLESLTLLARDGLVLRKDGEDVAQLQRIALLPGGRVDVLEFEPLGVAREVGAVESVGRLFALLAVFKGSGASGAQALANVPGDALEPKLIDGLTESLMEDALSEVVVELIRAHHDALPGFDLRTVLGLGP